MNRCLVVALAVLLVSSGVKEVQEALDYFVEETGIMSLIDCLQTGSLPQRPGSWSGLMERWMEQNTILEENLFVDLRLM
ncbi:hypothetical protein AMECASPLE_013746 [Ameca splendens]|uniref:Uncharacterized protein n=1 Tax=Ameca splendens TaxID=208324 RepID=A0ABV0YCD1_9TELE